MANLFSVEPALPEGFLYFPDFLSAEEEAALCRSISKIALHGFVFHGFEAKRKVASFGYDWNFEAQQLVPGKEIPEDFRPLIEKVSSQLHFSPGNFAELLITEYPRDAVINWHRDAPPFDLIAGISLLTDCTFRLRPQDKNRQNRNSIISFDVKRRSMYIIKGPARTQWQHSIAPVKATRYSITLRTLKNSYNNQH